MFQTSWNIRSGTPRSRRCCRSFGTNPNGFLLTFQNGVKPDSNDLGNFGSGDGAKYQFLSKFAPAFHVMVTALGMRSLRQHWGPINREEVELGGGRRTAAPGAGPDRPGARTGPGQSATIIVDPPAARASSSGSAS